MDIPTGSGFQAHKPVEICEISDVRVLSLQYKWDVNQVIWRMHKSFMNKRFDWQKSLNYNFKLDNIWFKTAKTVKDYELL